MYTLVSTGIRDDINTIYIGNKYCVFISSNRMNLYIIECGVDDFNYVENELHISHLHKIQVYDIDTYSNLVSDMSSSYVENKLNDIRNNAETDHELYMEDWVLWFFCRRKMLYRSETCSRILLDAFHKNGFPVYIIKDMV